MAHGHHEPTRTRFERPLLHTIHTLTFLVLLASGLLLFVPELRAYATGGYSLAIVWVHRWAGVASVALPFALLLYLGGPAVLAPPRTGTVRGALKAGHQAIVVAMTLLFAATGIVMWLRHPVYESIEDASRLLHGWMTYGAAILLLVHVLDVSVIGGVTRLSAARAGTTKTSPSPK